MTDKNYLKAHIKLHNGRIFNIFEYKDPLVRPYVYRMYEEHIDWSEHPGVEILGVEDVGEDTTYDFALLKFKDELHLLRAALIEPDLASLEIKQEIWNEFSVYYRRRLVNDVIQARRRLEYYQSKLDEYSQDPENYKESYAHVESSKLKAMLAGISANYPRSKYRHRPGKLGQSSIP